jgi:hypothetical protein
MLQNSYRSGHTNNQQLHARLYSFHRSCLPLQVLHHSSIRPRVPGNVFPLVFLQLVRPNSVTFLVAAEVDPCYSMWLLGRLGKSRPAPRCGAVQLPWPKFYVVPWFGLTGALATYLFHPDSTGLDLKEQE